MIALGSYPIQKRLGRTAKDFDLLATLEEFKVYVGPGNKPTITDSNHAFYKDGYGNIFDCELVWPGSTSEVLRDLILNDPDTIWDDAVQAWLPSLNILYMLKMSHRYKKNSPHFLKTMRDIQKMRIAGAIIQPEHQEFYKARKEATYSYGHPKLNQKRDTFFNPDDSFYVYDHDSIHEAVAIGERPAYVQYAIPGQEVLSSRDRFFNEVSDEVRRLGVYEETCVLALERSQIPTDFRADRDWSFKKALEKVCTSITSGWFREYAWENYDAVMREYASRKSYVDEFKRNSHKLRPYERKEV